MADAFGDDLFNVFDEDSTAARPTPDIITSDESKEASGAKDLDDSQRYEVIFEVN